MTQKNKAPWIFIRGLSRGQGHWGDFVDLFREQNPDAEIEFLDLAGNGERFQETSHTDTAEAARDLRSRSRWIREGRKVRMLAHSLGAMVAVEWMKQFPQDFEKLYLMNTSARNLGNLPSRLNPRIFSNVIRLLGVHSAEEHERLTLSVIANNAERIKEVLPRMAAYTAGHPVTWSNILRQLFAASKAKFPEQNSVPVEVIVGNGDRLVSPSQSLELARRWGVPAHIHPTGGHDLPTDDPQWLVEQLF